MHATPPDDATTTLPPARVHLVTLARRLARPVGLGDGEVASFAAGSREDLAVQFAAARAIANQARRAGARAVDATLLGGELRVALDVPDGVALSALPGRAHALTETAFHVPLVLQPGRLVSIPGPLPDAPDAPAAARLALDYLARVRALEVESLADEDPEGVHQMRVAIRRLRVILRVMRKLSPGPAVESAIVTVRALARVGGAVRDLDVVGGLLGEVLPAGPDLDAAAAHLAKRRDVAQERLRRVLAGARYAAEVERARATFSAIAAGAASARIDDAARALLARELRKLADDLDADLTVPGAYHEVRRQARRVRDLAEVFGAALRKRERAWRKRLQPVQGVLGRLNDIDTALALLPPRTPTLGPARAALGQQRLATLAELGPPLALLAVRIWRTQDD